MFLLVTERYTLHVRISFIVPRKGINMKFFSWNCKGM